MTLKVIGAGFGRTGTSSIKAALEELGFGPCYHQFELKKNPAHLGIWGKAARGEPVDWEKLFEDYQSTVDWPGCRYYKELMEAYPDAKVLLSVRDPERWYESTYDTIYKVVKQLRDAREAAHPSVTARKSPIWDGTFGGRFEDREHAIEIFNRHNEEVRTHVPPDRLLVYEVKEGWEPLCEFLGVEVPENEPFPHLNDAATYLNLPMAKRAFDRSEGQQGSCSTPGCRCGSAAPVPANPFLSHSSAQNMEKKVGRLRTAERYAEAHSYLKRLRSKARNVVGVQGTSKAFAAATAREKQ